MGIGRARATVAVAAVVLAAVAILVVVLPRPRSAHLPQPAVGMLARAIGAAMPLSSGDSEQRMCGDARFAPEQPILRSLDADCRASARMADLIDALPRCRDAACVRSTARELTAVARRTQAIEQRFAGGLTGDCRRFFVVESDYDAAVAAAADPLATLPGEPWRVPALERWREAQSAAESAIEGVPVQALLAACLPNA